VDQRAQAVCGIPGPGVLVGPPPSEAVICPAVVANGTVVTFGGPDAPPGVVLGSEKHETIHGVSVFVSTEPGGVLFHAAYFTLLARFPSQHAWLLVKATEPSPQAVGQRAYAILDSVHVS
jgi:hypothetical protein